MTITLNHTIVPAHDKEASAQFFAQIFDLKVEPPLAHFAVVRVNNQLTFDFDNRENFESHHYAFHLFFREIPHPLLHKKQATAKQGGEG